MEIPLLPVSRAVSVISSLNRTFESLSNILPDAPQFRVAPDAPFMMRELRGRTPQEVRPLLGITPPPLAHAVYDGFFGGGYSPPASPGTPFAPAGFHYVQMGSEYHRKMVKNARTPSLPPKMRKSREGPPNPHYGERPPRSTTSCSQPTCKVERQHEYIAWKYMGDTDNVCGCYSAKIRADTPRHLQSQTVSKFPVDHARAHLRPEQDPEEARRTFAWRKLYRESIDRTLDKKPDMPLIQCRTPDRVDGIDTTFDESEVDRGFESRGKLARLRASSLRPRIPRPEPS
jgi:hypothetical protein